MSSAAKKVAKLRDLATQEEALTRAANNWEKVYSKAQNDLATADTDRKQDSAAIRSAKAMWAEKSKRKALEAVTAEKQNLLDTEGDSFTTVVTDIDNLTKVLTKSKD
jgi:hypothetical protein